MFLDFGEESVGVFEEGEVDEMVVLEGEGCVEAFGIVVVEVFVESVVLEPVGVVEVGSAEFGAD